MWLNAFFQVEIEAVMKTLIQILVDYVGHSVIFAASILTLVVWVVYDQLLWDQTSLNSTEITGLFVTGLIMFDVFRLGYRKFRG